LFRPVANTGSKSDVPVVATALFRIVFCSQDYTVNAEAELLSKDKPCFTAYA
jgi:hypothetical protein